MILLLGDIHGEFSWLRSELISKDIRDCTMICVGDFGVGFVGGLRREQNRLEKLNYILAKRNVNLLSIRGNHDDPAYWNEIDLGFSNIELIPDYTFREIEGEKFFFVGGGISIDRKFRTPNVSYWNDETVCLIEGFVRECDVLVTHSAPRWIGPNDKKGIKFYCDRDPTLWDECVKEREDIGRLHELAKPKVSYAGHFHVSATVINDNSRHYILDINEIKEHTKVEGNPLDTI
ncbi:metallophosphoesterase [bacterium]|nr:metallophosphoesterase [bacterium]